MGGPHLFLDRWVFQVSEQSIQRWMRNHVREAVILFWIQNQRVPYVMQSAVISGLFCRSQEYPRMMFLLPRLVTAKSVHSACHWYCRMRSTTSATWPALLGVPSMFSMGMAQESRRVSIQFRTMNSQSVNAPVALLSIRVHVWNSAPMLVVLNPTWRSRELVELGGELVMTKCRGMWQFSQVGCGGYAFSAVGSCAVGGGYMASIN